MSAEEGWAQLVSTTDAVSDPIPITKDKFVFGRAKSADVCYHGNKLVSGQHCCIEKVDNGTVWLHDTSTNGTLVNLTKKVHKNKVQLNHGDEISIVYRKSEPDLNISYLFQDMAKLAEEELETTQEASSDLEATQEIDSDMDVTVEDIPDADLPSSGTSKRQAEADTEEEPESKKCKKDEATPKPDKENNNNVETTAEGVEKKNGTSTSDDKDAKKKGEENTSEKKAEESASSSGAGSAAAAAKCDDEVDAYEEALICIICQELLYNCVSLQPCLHSFCAGCYSDWMQRSTECPSCRMKVERINKNHLVNNLVEAYLKEHPNKKRPDEDLKELDAKNKITKEMFYPKPPTKPLDDDDDDDESDDEDYERDSDDNDDNSDDEEMGPNPGTMGLVTVHPPAPPPFVYRPPRTVCRQCPDYKELPVPKAGLFGTVANAVTAIGQAVTGAVTTALTGSPDGSTKPADAGAPGPSGATPGATPAATAQPQPGTSTEPQAGPSGKQMAVPPAFVCTTQNHILCQCCLQPMPDRRHEVILNKNLPSVQCRLCYRYFCHLYWGCRKADCTGCLVKLKDLILDDKAMGTIVLNNAQESKILKDYLESKGITSADFLRVCFERMDAGRYSCRDQVRFQFNADQVFCHSCALRNVRDLAYMYRKDIPNAELPAEVTARPDCYWGKNCRTQATRAHHAVNYNHICEQTRHA